MFPSKWAMLSDVRLKPLRVLGSRVLLGLIFFQPCALAAPAVDPVTRIQELDAKLAKIEKQQTLILNQQQEILKKLDTLKIWARRS